MINRQAQQQSWFIFTFTGLVLAAIFFSNALLPQYIVTVLAVMYLFYYVITEKFVIPKAIIKYLAIPTLLMFIGIVGSPGNELNDILKDGWYFSSPFILLCVGYLMMHKVRTLEPLLRLFVLSGTLLAFYHIVTIASDPALLLEASINEIRAEKGRGFFLSLTSLAIIILSRRFKISLWQIKYELFLFYAVVVINSVSLFFSFSRTMWITFSIFYAIGIGWLSRKKNIGWLIIAAVLAIFGILYYAIPKGTLSTDSMMGKLMNSVNEVIMSDYSRPSDIALHWRGYESYMAMRTYLSGSILNIFAGYGFGKLVDVGREMYLGGEYFRYVPIMHNGYMYLLVKTGFVGCLLYFVYLFKILRTGVFYAHADNVVLLVFAGRFIMALAMILYFTTFVIAGMFNKSSLVPLIVLLGIFLAYVKLKGSELNYVDR